ncbi:MAG: hypothetical protein GF353_24950 [Candidatus Lokiarchaeota archaeon]|nr:hypothetical protein [Candidatus Lokiarchaeota archaeon]
MNNRINFIFAFCVFLLISICCDNVNKSWDRTTKNNTIKDYEAFLEKYPESAQSDTARGILAELYFNVAESTNTVEAFQNYIHKFPDCSLAVEASEKIAGIVFLEVEKEQKIQKYNDFIKDYAGRKIVAEAEKQKVGLFANLLSTKKTFTAKQKIEDEILNDIFNHGIGARFVISTILPKDEKNVRLVSDSHGELTDIKRDAHSGSIALENEHGDIYMKTLYPRDKLEFIPTAFGLQPSQPFGNGAIWRFIGNVDFEGYKFIGDRKNPLTFMLIQKAGFVYLHGKGTIKKKNQIVATLP